MVDNEPKDQAGQGNRAAEMRQLAGRAPETLKRHITLQVRELLADIANDDTPVNLTDIPVSHLYCAVNCMLKVLAQQEQTNEVFELVDGVQAGITVSLEDYKPGAGEALHELYLYYRWQAEHEAQ